MAKIIKVNGAIIDVEPKNGKDFSLKELQSIVGGYIDIIHLKSGNILVVNDEGAINGSCINLRASKIYGSYLFGDVLHCKSEEVK